MFKTLSLLFVLAVVAHGRSYGNYNGGNIDPGFSRYPNQGGFVPDAGFGHGQGGLPNPGVHVPDAGFGQGYDQGGFHNQGAGGVQPRIHRHGYQEHDSIPKGRLKEIALKR